MSFPAPPCPPSARPPPPPWFTFDQDIEMWWDFLNNRGCDCASMQELACLAQCGDKGYVAANTIVSKIFKAEHEGITNYSAWLRSRVLNARHQVMDEYDAKWGRSHKPWQGDIRKRKWSTDEWKSDGRQYDDRWTSSTGASGSSWVEPAASRSAKRGYL